MASDYQNNSPIGSGMNGLVGAPFADRFAAKLVDGAILLIPYLMLHFSTVPFFGPILLSFCYYIFFEASAAQATPGKRLAGLRVVSLNGTPITLKDALIRMVLRSISTFLFLLPYLAIFFTKRRQAAHDFVSETLVVTGKNDEPLVESWLHSFKDFLHQAQAWIQTKRGK